MSLLILGMHRTGTSAVASVVERLGLSPGRGTQWAVEAANPRGLHEWLETVEFNDEWLTRFGGAWWAPPRVGPSSWRELDMLDLELARRKLEYFSPSVRGWYVKDPRISLLLPLWDRLLLREYPTIVVVRSPQAVATSLRLRSGINPTRALSLWAEYYRATLASLGARPSLVVDYEQMLADPDETVEAIAAFIGGGQPTSEVPAAHARDGVDPSLRRSAEVAGSDFVARLVFDLSDVHREMAQSHLQSPKPGLEDYKLPPWASESLDEARDLFRALSEMNHYRQANERIIFGGSYRAAQILAHMTEPIRSLRKGSRGPIAKGDGPKYHRPREGTHASIPPAPS